MFSWFLRCFLVVLTCKVGGWKWSGEILFLLNGLLCVIIAGGVLMIENYCADGSGFGWEMGCFFLRSGIATANLGATGVGDTTEQCRTLRLVPPLTVQT